MVNIANICTTGKTEILLTAAERTVLEDTVAQHLPKVVREIGFDAGLKLLHDDTVPSEYLDTFSQTDPIVVHQDAFMQGMLEGICEIKAHNGDREAALHTRSLKFAAGGVA